MRERCKRVHRESRQNDRAAPALCALRFGQPLLVTQHSEHGSSQCHPPEPDRAVTGTRHEVLGRRQYGAQRGSPQYSLGKKKKQHKGTPTKKNPRFVEKEEGGGTTKIKRTPKTPAELA